MTLLNESLTKTTEIVENTGDDDLGLKIGMVLKS